MDSSKISMNSFLSKYMTKICGFLEQEDMFNTSILIQDTKNNLRKKTTNF